MRKQLSLVELAVHGYEPSRVNKGSWLERAFGMMHSEENADERVRKSDQNKETCKR